MQPLQPAPRETIPSYLSRLAASRGVTTADYAIDLGGSLKRFLRCDPQAIEALVRWAKLSTDQTEELLSWTGVPIGDVRMAYRGEPVISRALRNPVVEGCPECLRDDARSDPAEPLAAMVMRGDWQLRDVSVCLHHGKLLVPLWTSDLPTARYDIQAQLAPLSDRIMPGEMDGAPAGPSPFDIWLDNRLAGEADPTWMAACSTSASAAFCRMFGHGLLPPGPGNDPIRHRHDAAAAGFAIIKGGRDAIKDSVIALSNRSASVADPVHQAFGQLVYALETHLLEEASFDIFRAVLRAAVLAVWPVPAGEAILGSVVEKRRLHSVGSAAAELKIHSERLRPMLVEAGAVGADDPRPDARATFDAEMFGHVLREIPQLISKKAMCDVLGATSADLDGLVAAGILQPRTSVPGARRRWVASDAEALLDELRNYAECVTANEDTNWITIHDAQARQGISVETVFAGIRAGAIPVRRSNLAKGYRGFEIAVASLSIHAPKGDLRHGVPEGRSLAEFGRTIGIREADRLLALVEAGDLHAIEKPHPVMGRRQWRVSESAMAAFRQRFMTLSMIEAEFALPRLTARWLFGQAGIAPYAKDGRSYGNIFLRCDAEPVLRRAGYVSS